MRSVSITDAVIPVAGLGTRLLPATRSQPKEMLPVLDRPVVQHVVEELVGAGISRVLFVTGRRKRAIEDHFDADPELGSGPLLDGVQILYTRQPEPRGLGDAIAHGRALGASDGVVVALGDAIVEGDVVKRLIAAFEAAQPAAVIAVEQVAAEQVNRYGIVAGPLEAITALVEKPDPESAPSNWAVAARYVFSPAVLEELARTPPGRGGEVQVADALGALIDRGERVIAVPLLAAERRHDIGTVESYVQTFLHFARQDPRFSDAH
ncbi:MAG: UTP--glucose-1-phosphate uridylyltransferase [Solirubrobacterales bacterium]|nr:UTP--glucose-1-phosphate uridylyltransferase [Solirubrobacterales bacterium]